MNTAKDFTMADNSSKPYAWMTENIEVSEIGNVEKFVREYVKTSINTQNYSEATDKTVYKVWRSGWEFDQIVSYINEFIAESV